MAPSLDIQKQVEHILNTTYSLKKTLTLLRRYWVNNYYLLSSSDKDFLANVITCKRILVEKEIKLRRENEVKLNFYNSGLFRFWRKGV